jgi:hypothetical protein
MKPVFAAIREIQEAADIEYKKHGCDSLTVEGVHVRVHVTKTKAIYMFGDRPNVKRYLTLDDALEALTDHLAEAVARRMFH